MSSVGMREYPGDQRCTVHSGRKRNASSGRWFVPLFFLALLTFGVYENVSAPPGDPANLPRSSFITWADQPSGEIINP
jgi:hypothetical protein